MITMKGDVLGVTPARVRSGDRQSVLPLRGVQHFQDAESRKNPARTRMLLRM
jgi:hypothetical protein